MSDLLSQKRSSCSALGLDDINRNSNQTCKRTFYILASKEALTHATLVSDF
jgi:hypothetical protein